MKKTAARSSSTTTLRTLRLLSGLWLLFYVTSHLVNLSLGLVSVAAMDAARPLLSGFLTGPGTGLLLMTALFVHYVIGLRAVYVRPSISGTTQDIVQVMSGLMVIPLLATHAIGVLMLDAADVDFGYAMAIRLFWLSNPEIGLIQVLLLTTVWVHGCAGLFMWLRSRPTAARALPWLYLLAVAIPVAALLGYAQAGRSVLADAAAGLPPMPGALPDPAAEIPYDLVKQITRWTIWISLGISVLVLCARAMRQRSAPQDSVTINTVGVGEISAETGQTLLDALRAADQPHANLCSGRGRCGTCAVRIVQTATPLPPPSPLEQATLDRIKMGDDVRLACQAMLTTHGALTVERLLPPDFEFSADNGRRAPAEAQA